MVLLKTILILLICFVVALIAVIMIIKYTINLLRIIRTAKSLESGHYVGQMVYNKKTGKLEADNHEVLPFE